MKKQFLLLGTTLALATGLRAQCTLTASITASKSTDLCSGDTLTLSGPAPGDAWTSKATIGGTDGRDGPVGFSIDSKGYIGSGWDNGAGTAHNDMWEYDPATDAWTQKANIPVARAYAFGMAIGSKGYLGGGYNSSTGGGDNSFWEFDPLANTWTPKANYAGSIENAPAFSIGSKGYVTGGLLNNAETDQVWEYDPASDTWTQKASFGGGTRFSTIAFAIGSTGYVGAGLANYTSARFSDLWAYAPSADTWTQKAGIPGASGPRDAATGFSIGNKGYVSGGNNNGNFTNDLWEYDGTADSWTQKLSVPGSARIRAAAFSIGNKGYFGSGTDPNYHVLTDFYEYTPGLSYSWSNGSAAQSITTGTAGTYSLSVSSLATGTCVATASQTVGVTITPTVTVGGPASICSGNSETLTASGATTYSWDANAGNAHTASVVVSPSNATLYNVTGANGQCAVSATLQVNVNAAPTVSVTADGPIAVCDAGSVLFTASDPGGSWLQKNNFPGTARYDAVGFSIGSKGYIGLGQPNGFPTGDFWEYDPSTDAWTQKANFGGYFRVEAAAFAIGSKGYVGLGTEFGHMTDFWEFDPAMNTWTQKGDYPGTIRTQGTTFTIGNIGYIAGGYDLNDQRTDEVYAYDPATDTWAQKASFGGGVRASAGAFVLGGLAYMGTGDIPAYGISADMWAYDPAGDTWTQKTNFPGQARNHAVSFALGGKGYMGGGSMGLLLSDFYAYTPATDSWTRVADFGGGETYEKVSFVIGSQAYTGTGVNSSGALNDFWEYDPSVAYSWSNNATTPSISVNSSGNYSVTVSVANGCSTTVSKSFSVTPTPTVTISGPNAICAGDNLHLTAGGADAYVWSANASSSTSASVTITPSAGDSYTVTGAVGTCTGTAVQTVSVNALPTVAITGNNEICAGSSTSLTANGATSYTWSSNAGSVTTATASLSPGSDDTFTVTGFDGNCSNTATYHVDVDALPNVSVNSASICAGQSAVLTGNGASTYSWSPAGTLSSTSGTTVTASPASSSSYTVTGTDGNGCVNTAVSNVVINCTATGIETLSEGSVSIYPNPAADFFVLDISTMPDHASIEVYDVTGKKMISVSMTGNSSRIDISGLANGIYQVRVLSNSGVIFQSKLVRAQ